MPSIFAQDKRDNLDEVKAAADAVTRERLAQDLRRAEQVLAARAPKRDVSAVAEAEVVTEAEAPAPARARSSKPKK